MQIQTLAIVGNGFDLAHSLPTSYAQFKNSQETASVASFQQFVAKYCPESSEWTSFEDRINDLSMSCFQRSHDDAFDYDSVISDVQEINKVFDAIRSSLLTYLKRVTSNTKIDVMPSIAAHIDSNTYVMNFNYTATVDLYAEKVYNVHGSLTENEIVLGYDYRDEPCVIEFDMMKWSKPLCRERLAFCRFVKQRMGLSTSAPLPSSFVDDVLEMQSIKNSGKGFEEDDWEGFTHADWLKQFYKGHPECYEEYWPGIEWGNIRKVVVLGHSLTADKVYLQTVLGKCVNIQEIILFTFPGERADELAKKKQFLEQYTSNIVTCFY